MVIRDLSLGSLVVFVACAVTFVGGCSREEASGPPALYVDEDVCVLCGMIISEEKFAAGIVKVTPDGRVPLLFDDVGDMLAHLKTSPVAGSVELYVHDFVTHAWIDAEDAWFTVSESLSTPMASGIAAFSDESAAKAHIEAFPGVLFTWNQLRTR